MDEIEVAERPCVPEWCEQGGPEHDDVCDNGPMEAMTKRDFVDALVAAARHGIFGFLVMRSDEFSEAEATEAAVDEVEEAAVCRAGIGSCGRGWCNHG